MIRLRRERLSDRLRGKLIGLADDDAKMPSNSSSTETFYDTSGEGFARLQRKKQLKEKYLAWANKTDENTRMVDNIRVRPVAFLMPLNTYIVSLCAGFSCFFIGYYPETVLSAGQQIFDQYSNPGDTVKTAAYFVLPITFVALFVSFIIAAAMGDVFGRRRCMMVCYCVIVFGAFLSCVANFDSMVVILTGLFICAIPFGILETNALAYIVECSSTSNRGTTVLFHTFALFTGYICSYTASLMLQDYPNEIQWKWKLGLICLYFIPQMVFSKSIPDSPRWSIMVGNNSKAYNSLRSLRKVKFLAIREYSSIDYMNQTEFPIFSPWKKIKKIIRNRHTRRSLFVSMSLIAFLSIGGGEGGESFNAYLSKDMLSQVSPLGSPQVAANNFLMMCNLSTGVLMLLLFWVPDVIGRKNTLICGFSGMAIGLLFILLSIQSNETRSPPASASYVDSSFADKCNTFRTCFDCTMNIRGFDNRHSGECGYCAHLVDGAPTMGMCVKIHTPRYRKKSQDWFKQKFVSQRYAEKGPCSLEAHKNRTKRHNFKDKPEFTMWFNSCPTRFHLSVVAVLIFSASYYSLTFRTVYTYIAEVPPQWSRTMFIALCLAFKNIISILQRLAFPSTNKKLSHGGTPLEYLGFYNTLSFNIVMCMLAVVFVWLWVPETRGRSLEFTDLLFMKRRERREIAKIRSKRIQERVISFHKP